MNPVNDLIEDLSTRHLVTASEADAAFRRCAWSPRGPQQTEIETTWYSGETGAWIQDFPDGIRIEIILWSHDVDEEVLSQEDGVEALYEQGEEVLPVYQRDLLSHLSGPGQPIDFPDEEEEFITVNAWQYRNITLLIGLKQGDTDLPVEVVASIR